MTKGQFHKRQKPAFKMPNSGVYIPIFKYQFHKTLLAFKMPKSSTLITHIAKNKRLKSPFVGILDAKIIV